MSIAKREAQAVACINHTSDNLKFRVVTPQNASYSSMLMTEGHSAAIELYGSRILEGVPCVPRLIVDAPVVTTSTTPFVYPQNGETVFYHILKNDNGLSIRQSALRPTGGDIALGHHQLDSLISGLDSSLEDTAPHLANAARMALTGSKLGPPHGSIPLKTQIAAEKFRQLFKARWKKSFPGVSLGFNSDSGFFGPFADVTSGSAPPIVVKTIEQDFNNWGLPQSNAANQIAQTLTRHLVNHAGQPQMFNGFTPVETGRRLVWQ
ncbi:MAG: hypothetical protein AAF404_17560, partial [Pseudomonadota bacterium]